MAGELIAQFGDHAGRVSRLIEQFKNKPDLEALIRSYLLQLQDVEDALFEIILERNLDVAVGVQLEAIGGIVQQPRTTSDDERFRTAIRARIAINLSNATPEDVIKVASLLLVDGEAFRIREEPPAQLRVEVIDPLTSADVDLLFDLLEAADAAGVRLVLQWNASLSPADKLILGGGSVGGALGSTTGATANPGKFASAIGG